MEATRPRAGDPDQGSLLTPSTSCVRSFDQVESHASLLIQVVDVVVGAVRHAEARRRGYPQGTGTPKAAVADKVLARPVQHGSIKGWEGVRAACSWFAQRRKSRLVESSERERLLRLEQASCRVEREAAEIVGRVPRSLERPHQTEGQQLSLRAGGLGLGPCGGGAVMHGCPELLLRRPQFVLDDPAHHLW